MSKRAVHVLLVEDNEGDVLLFEEALSGCRAATTLDIAPNGPVALQQLRAGRDGTLPDLVLLDLNLPGMSGGEVLGEMKADPELRATPVVIFTGSRAREDVTEAYDRHANSFITKPASFAGYQQVIRCIEEYWFATAVLPERAP
jgi:chemotaxis family two-component system response regulator Rcp1